MAKCTKVSIKSKTMDKVRNIFITKISKEYIKLLLLLETEQIAMGILERAWGDYFLMLDIDKVDILARTKEIDNGGN